MRYESEQGLTHKYRVGPPTHLSPVKFDSISVADSAFKTAPLKTVLFSLPPNINKRGCPILLGQPLSYLHALVRNGLVKRIHKISSSVAKPSFSICKLLFIIT